MEWKNWRERESERMEMRQKKLQQQKVKEESWSLYRECTAILEENKEKWQERSEAEKKRKLEDEKNERLSMAGQKRRHLVKKLQDEADKKGRKKESK